MPPSSNLDASAPGILSWHRRQWAWWAGTPLLLTLCGLALMPAQHDVFMALNRLAAALPDAWWASWTMLGDTLVLLALLSPLLLWRPQAMLAIVAAIPAGGLFSVLAKRLFDSPRPAAVLDAAQFHVIGPLLNAHSFPSGHAITVFAAASAVLAVTAPQLRSRQAALLVMLAVALAAAVGLSRVAVGAHWPVDVWVGAGGGWLAGLTGALLARRRPLLWQSPRFQFGLAGLLAVVSLWLLWRPQDYPAGSAAIWLAAMSSWLTLAGLVVLRRLRAKALALEAEPSALASA
jgi:membrane-associated phospholipid phosphatase